MGRGIRELGEAVFERVGRGVGRVQERKSLPSDLLESDDAYLVVFDAPGATRSDVQVRFVDGEVQVRIDRFRDFHEGSEMRFPGRGLSLDGAVELPADALVDADGATATLTDNGTLRIEIPKSSDMRQVEVREESDATTDAAESTGDETDSGVDVGGADADDA
ncbi:MAG: Hsp20/alpha crystallin family protein [Salinigranum sp.]